MSRRLFVSVDLNGLADAVQEAQEPFRVDGLNPIDPAQAHVTLKFLGDVEESRVNAVEDALSRAVLTANVDPFEAHFAGYGVFPSLDYISVIWLGVEAGSEQLTRLHEAVEREMTDLGFDPEDHEFTPHVTLARMDHAARKKQVQRIVQEGDPDVGTLRVEEVRLTESTLTSEGPVYDTVAEFPL